MYQFLKRSSWLGVLLAGVMLQAGTSVAADQYGYDGGFFLRSADENFMIKANGLFQMNYQYQMVDGTGNPNVSTLGINRARLGFSGNAYSPDWTYFLLGEMASGAFVMIDYYANWHHCDAFNVRFGQYRIPYNREQLVDASRLTAIDGYTINATAINRSYVNSVFGINREPGVTFWGMLAENAFEYYLTVSNGNGINSLNAADDVDMRYTLRMAYHLMGNHGYWQGDFDNSEEAQAAIGFGGYWNKLDLDADGAFDNIFGLTVDLAWAWRGWDANIEGHMGRVDLDAGGDATNNAVRALVGYFVLPGEAEFAGQFNWIEPDTTPSTRIMQFGPVLSWFLQGRDVKLQFQYDYTMAENALATGDKTDHGVLAQAQFNF
jgi:hypothetical protein